MANSRINKSKNNTDSIAKTEFEKEIEEIKGLEEIGLLPRGSYNVALLKCRENSDD